MRLLRGLALCVLISTISACSSTAPKEQFVNASYSRPQTMDSNLRNLIEPKVAQNPGKSAVSLLETGQEALLARIALIDEAQYTLDLQYYIWQGDHSGVLLIERIMAAAQRGVRVRLLLDDHNLVGSSKALSTLAKYPNIYIKLYNPYGGDTSVQFTKTMTLLGNFSRLNHRMHNKALIADNQVAIIGGRNIGDEYFDLSQRKNFVDLDVVTLGPIVNDISHSFDNYWNSNWAISAQSLDSPVVATEKELTKLHMQLQRRLKKLPPLPYSIEYPKEQVLRLFKEELGELHWGKMKLVVDPPGKALTDNTEPTLSEQLDAIDMLPSTEVLLCSPYLVPDSETFANIAQLNELNVSIKILTNSYDSNDVRVAQYGYTRRREQLLDANVSLFEYRADGQYWRQHQAQSIQEIPIGLHAKFGIYDRSIVWISSANLDPRSKSLNTEIGLLIDNPAFAQQLHQWFERNTELANADKVIKFNNKLFWKHLNAQGEEQMLTEEPGRHWWDWFGLTLQRLLPIEEQL